MVSHVVRTSKPLPIILRVTSCLFLSIYDIIVYPVITLSIVA